MSSIFSRKLGLNILFFTIAAYTLSASVLFAQSEKKDSGLANVGWIAGPQHGL